MRRVYSFAWVTAPLTAFSLAFFVMPVQAEDQPGYWAGNVSLAQPQMLPPLDDAEAAPMPPRVSAPVATITPSRRVQPVVYVEPIQAPITSQARQALNFYGGYSARATLNQMPRRTPIQPASVGQMQHNGKPFQTATSGETISPYLNLFRSESEESESAPNYFAFVRPQLEQRETQANQQRDQDRSRQTPRRRATTGTTYQATGGPARYMDTAQFYGGWR